MMKLVQVIERGEYWQSGEVEDRAVRVSIESDKGVLYSVRFGNGEPEDMTLNRDLSDAYTIAEMVHKAYQLGALGVPLHWTTAVEEDE